MKIAAVLITLLVVGGFVTGFAGFFGAMATQYGQAGSSAYKDFSTLNSSSQYYLDVQSDIDSQYGIVNASQEHSVDATTADLWGPANLISGAYNAVMFILKTPTYFIAIIYDVGGAMMLPAWAITMLIAIMTVIVLFSLIAFLTGRDII